MNPVVAARKLGKDYEVYRRPADRLLELFTFRQRHVKFPALADLDFEIEKGQSVGLIGQNGAGKSTLLKLVAGVARPSRGDLEVRGAVASILELGTGFHPDFSGKDNAALNAAMLGLSPREISAALPKIFEFSELGIFLDRPVRVYSSGMYMRLAFSVAVSVDPDILIVDEALAVGDGYFQKKCVDRIREFQKADRTIIFCSHALYFVTTLCSRTIWLDGGRIMADGPSVDVVHDYETFLLETNRDDRTTASEGQRYEVDIDSISVTDGSGAEIRELESGAPLSVSATIDTTRLTRPVRVGVAVVRAADETRCCTVVTPPDGLIEPGERARGVELRISTMPLTRGDYGVVVFVEDADRGVVLGRRDLVPAFRVSGDRYEVGVIRIPHEWKVRTIS